MKKALKLVSGAVAILLAVFLIVLTFGLGSFVKSAVVNIGSKMTGAEIKLDKVDLSFFTGRGRIEGLEIGNPPGFDTPAAIKVGALNLALKPMSLFRRVVVIESIVIEGPEITYEFGRDESNLGQIVKNISGGTKSVSAGNATQEQKQAPGKKVVIRSLVIRNARITLRAKLLQGAAGTVVLPEISMADIGKDGEGVTFAQAGTIVLNAILDGSGKLSGKGLSGLLQGAGELLGSGKKQSREAQKAR